MKKMRKRALSWLLTLAMTLSMLPMPTALAVKNLTATIDKLDAATGEYVITVSGGSAGGSTGAYAFALVPNVKTAKNGATPSELIGLNLITSSTQTSAMMQTQINEAELPGGTYVVGGGMGETFKSDGTIEIKGKLGAGSLENVKKLFSSGYYLPGASTPVEKDDITAIPYMVILVTAGGDPALTQGGGVNLEPPAAANLTAASPVVLTSGTSVSIPITNVGGAGASINWAGVTETLGTGVTSSMVSYSPQSGSGTAGAAGTGNDTNSQFTLALDWDPDSGLGSLMGGYAVYTIPYATTGDNVTKYLSITVQFQPAGMGTATAGALAFRVEEGSTASETKSVAITHAYTKVIYDSTDAGGFAWAIGTAGIEADALADGTDVAASAPSITVTGQSGWRTGDVYNDTLTIPYAADTSNYGYMYVPVTVNVVAASGPLFTATPNPALWNVAGTAQPITITMQEQNNKAGSIVSAAWTTGDVFSSPVDTGSINGNFNAGATITFTIVPTNDYLAAGNKRDDTLTITYNDGLGGDNKTLEVYASVDVPAAAEYSVTYHSNEPTGTATNMPADGTVTDGGSYTIPSTTPALTGYTFQGWNTLADGNGTSYGLGDTLTITANVDLYAKWQLIPVTSGSVTVTVMENNTGNASAAVKLKETTSGDEVSSFTGGAGGVYTNATVPFGTYDVYVDGTKTDEQVTLDASHLTATATVNFFTLEVKIGAGGGGTVTIPAAKTAYLAGSSATVTVAATTGYGLKDWTVSPTDAVTAPTGLTGSVTIPTTMTDNDGITLTANFLPNITAAVIKDNNGGSGKATIGDTLGVTITTGDNTILADGAVIYEWYVGSTKVGAAATYKVLAADAGETITVKVIGDGTTYLANATSSGVTVLTAANVTVDKTDWTLTKTYGAAVTDTLTIAVGNTGGTASTALTASLASTGLFTLPSGGTIGVVAAGSSVNLVVGLHADAAKAVIAQTTVNLVIKDAANNVLHTIPLKLTVNKAGITVTGGVWDTTKTLVQGANPALSDFKSAVATSVAADGSAITNTYDGTADGSTTTNLKGVWSVSAPTTYGASGAHTDGELTFTPTDTTNYNAGKQTGISYTVTGPTYHLKLTTPTANGTQDMALAETWTALNHGYSSAVTKLVTITNEGNTDAWIQVTGGSDFTITETTAGISSGVKVGAGQTAQFTLNFATGKDAKTSYTEAFTVKAFREAGLTNLERSVTYTPTQEVKKVKLDTPTIGTITGADTIGGTEGTVTIGNYTDITAKDANVVIQYKKGSGSWATATVDTNGVVSGLGAGSYVFRAVPSTGAATNYDTSADSAAAVVADGTKYTGQVTVKVDGTATNAGISKVEFAVTGGGTVATTHAGNGVYKTTAGALDTATSASYAVVVTTTDGGKYTFTNKTVTGTSPSTEVELFTVKFKDAGVTANTYATLTTAAITAKVGTAPANVAGLSADDEITTGDIVPTGTGVTFTIETLAAKYDYTSAWTVAAASGAQTNASGAKGTLSYTEKRDEVTATLTLNTYKVSGTVDTVDNFAKVVISGTTAEGEALAANFTATIAANANGTFFVNVPASDATGYTVTATAAAEAVINGSDTATGVAVAASHDTATPQTGKFSFTSTGATYSLSLGDGTYTATSDKTTATPATNPLSAIDFGYGAQGDISMTLASTGNSKLYNVKLATAATGTGADFEVTGAAADLTNGTGITLDATGGTNASTTFTITPQEDMPAGDYTFTATVTADTKATGGVALKSAVYKITLTVNKGKITAASVTTDDVGSTNANKPVAGETAPTTATVGSAAPTGSVKVKSVNWSGLTGGKFGAATAHTATVVLEPANTNYIFDTNTATAPLTGFTINGKNTTTGAAAADGKVTCVIAPDGSIATLTYTFLPTAPGTLTMTAAGTDWDEGEIELSTAGSNIKYYFAVSTDNNLVLTGDQIKTAGDGGAQIQNQVGNGNTATATVGTLPTGDTTYYVYAAARVDDGTVTGDWTTASGNFKTWYKLTVAVENTDANASLDATFGKFNSASVTYNSATSTVKTDGVNGSVVIGVKQNDAVTLSTTKGNSGWAFDKWDVTLTGGQYKPVANNKTITATFKKVITGTATLSATTVEAGDTIDATNGGATKVYVGNDLAVFTGADATADLAYQWQYTKDNGTTWSNVDTTGHDTASWKVTAKNGDESVSYAGAQFRVQITYSTVPDGTTSVNSAVTNAFKAPLSQPTNLQLVMAQRGETNGATDAQNAKGGLYLTFDASAEDVGAAGTNPVKSYTVSVFKGGAVTAHKTQTVTATGAAGYTLHVLATDVAPTYDTQADTYTVKIVANVADGNTIYANSSQTNATSAANSGRAVLDKGLLSGNASGSIAAGDGVFTAVPYDGSAHTVSVTTADADKTGAVTVYYDGATGADTNGKTNVDTYTIGVATAGGSLYLPEPASPAAAFAVGTWKITKTQVSSVSVTGITTPTVGGTPVLTATVPAAAGYVDNTTNADGAGKATVVWKNSSNAAVTGNFVAGEVYTAEITYKTDANHDFAASVAATATATSGNVTVPTPIAPASGLVTVKVKFPALATAAPDITVSGTAWNKGTMTKMEVTSAGAVTFRYAYRLASAPALDAAALATKTSATGDAGAITGGKSTWTGSVDFTPLLPNTQYAVDAIAVIGTGANQVVSPVASKEFTTPYKVTVKGTNGTVAVNSGTPAASQDISAAGTDTLNLALTPTAGYQFKEWKVTAGAGSVGGTDPAYTYSPSGTAGAITVEAVFEAFYLVEYDFNTTETVSDGSLPTDSGKFVAGGKVTVPAGAFTRTGFTFKGWNVTSGYTGTPSAPVAGGDVNLADLITANTVSGNPPAAGATLKLFAMWESIEFTVDDVSMTNAVYNQNDAQYTAANKVNPQGGGGTFTFVMGTTGDSADKYPAFLKVDGNTGAITLTDATTRIGAVGTYKFKVTVTDTTTNDVKDAIVTLVVDKATPVIDSFTYNNGSPNYDGDPVVKADGTSITATVKDPYDSTKELATGTWVATDSTFNGKTPDSPNTQNYSFVFTVTGADAGNYNSTAAKVESLTAEERDPNVGLKDPTDNLYKTEVVQDVTVKYGVAPTGPIPVTIQNTGNTAYKSLTVAKSGADAALFGDPNGTLTQDLASGAETSFTFTVPANQEVETYTVTYTVTGTATIPTEGDKTIEATYTYNLKVEPAEITGAEVYNISKPAKNVTATATLDKATDTNVGGETVSAAISWKDNAGAAHTGVFKDGESYTATIVLTADDNHIFAAANNATPNYKVAHDTTNKVDATTSGNPKVTVASDGTTATLEWKFEAMAPGNISQETGAKDFKSGEITKLETDSTQAVTFYYVVGDTQDTPTKEQVLAGNVASGTKKGSGTQASDTLTGGKASYTGSIPVNGLAPNKTYYVYSVARVGATGEVTATPVETTIKTPWKLTVEVTSNDGVGGKLNSVVGVIGDIDANDAAVETSLPATQSFTASPETGWLVKEWKVDGVQRAKNTNTYELNTATIVADEYEMGLSFHKVLTGTPVIDGTPGEGVTLEATAGTGATQLAVGGTPIDLTTASSISYQWVYSTDDAGTVWTPCGADDRTFTIPTGDPTYAGAKFKVTVTYTGDPNADGAHSSQSSAPTGEVAVALSTPGVAAAPNTGTDGGIKIDITKSTEDDNVAVGGNPVKEYVVDIYDGTTKVGSITVTADGNDKDVTIELDGTVTGGTGTVSALDPTKEYTVKVKAKETANKGYSESAEASATSKPAKKTLTLADLGTLSFPSAVFNGRTQTVAAIASPAGVGDVTIYYSNNASDTAGKLNFGTYNIYVSVTEGTSYTALARTDTTKTWSITQASAAFDAVTNATGKTGNITNLTTLPVIKYATGSGDGNAAYNNGVVTGYYTLTYTLVSDPDGAKNTTIADPANFMPTKDGNWVIKVKAAYDTANLADPGYQADVAVPGDLTFTIKVSNRTAESISLTNPATDGAVNSVTYGTTVAPNSNGGFYDASTAAKAKEMSLIGLVVTITYDSGDPDVIVIRDATDAAKFIWASSDATVNTGRTGTVLTMAKAGSTGITVKYGALEAPETVTYTLGAKALDYTVSGSNITFGGTTTGSIAITTALVGDDDVAIGATNYTLSSENVGTPTVSATDAALSGTDKDFYALGTATNNTITISAATIGSVTVVTQTPAAGTTIDKTIGTNNTVTGTGIAGTPTITWQEKDGNSWKTTTDTKFEAGKEYRPVVTVTADSNHKLVVSDNYTINGDKHGANNATIEAPDGDKATFTGDSTKLAGTPVLKFQDDAMPAMSAAVDAIRNVGILTGDTLGKYTVTLKATGDTVLAVDVTVGGSLSDKIAGVIPGVTFDMAAGDEKTYTVDLTGIPTDAVATGNILVTAQGKNAIGDWVKATYALNLTIANRPVTPPIDGGGGGGSSKLNVKYDIDSKLGSTKDKTTEQVEKDKSPVSVPTVTVKDAEKNVFVGWTLDPKAEKIKLTNPKEAVITEDTTFYAVFALIDEHEHYIKGYDSGIFAPADNISRAQVAAIIARACLDGFNENNDYGNGGYSDVASDHWAASAIAYCTDKGVFVGVGEGMFEPERSITRQEFALVFARMAGLMNTGDMPFTDAGTTADWAMSGVYTAFAKGWLDGYADGTFKPWNNIARSEAVKIVNRYLNRGVDKNGIANVSGDLKQWPDVPESYWAYYEIIEASNDHTFYFTNGENPPEVYTKAYIEQASWGK